MYSVGGFPCVRACIYMHARTHKNLSAGEKGTTLVGKTCLRLSLAKLTTAVLLVIKIVLTEQLVATILQATLAPVLCPKDSSFNGSLGRQTRLGNLLKTLPTGRGERRSEIGQPKLSCLQSGSLQAESETLQATAASLGLTLQSSDNLQPLLMIVVAINPLQSKTLCMPFTFLLADFILLTREDIWIEIIYGGTDVMSKHPLHDSRRARSTTGMQQYLLHTCRHHNLT